MIFLSATNAAGVVTLGAPNASPHASTVKFRLFVGIAPTSRCQTVPISGGLAASAFKNEALLATSAALGSGLFSEEN